MSEHATRTIAALQRRLSGVTGPDETETVLRLVYRAMVLDAVQALPRNALPRDLGAVGILVEAGELFATALYFSQGTSTAKAFIGRGLDELADWLQRCRSLFERYGDLAAELPPPKPKAGNPQRVAAAYAQIINRMFQQIMEHMDIEVAIEDEDRESSSEGGKLIAIPGQTIKEIAAALGSIMCCWIDPPHVDAVMATIYAGHEALCQCRPLVEVEDPEVVRGNA